MLPAPIQILDLDSCIFDDHWRLPMIDLKNPNLTERYAKYHAAHPQDEFVNTHVVRYKWRIVISTARPTIHHDSTREQLAKHGIHPFAMLMRNPHDHRSAVEVKKEHMMWLLNIEEYKVNLQDIKEFVDDRIDVLNMIMTSYPSIKTRHTCIDGVIHG